MKLAIIIQAIATQSTNSGTIAVDSRTNSPTTNAESLTDRGHSLSLFHILLTYNHLTFEVTRYNNGINLTILGCF